MADAPSSPDGRATLVGAVVAGLVAGVVLLVLTAGNVGSGPLRVVVAIVVGIAAPRVVDTLRE